LITESFGNTSGADTRLFCELTWKVIGAPVYDREGKPIQKFKAIQRDDTTEIFTVAGEKYHPVQNEE